MAGLQCTVFGQKSSAEGCCALSRVGASSTSSPTPSATHTPPTSQQRRVRRLYRCRFPVAYSWSMPARTVYSLSIMRQRHCLSVYKGNERAPLSLPCCERRS